MKTKKQFNIISLVLLLLVIPGLTFSQNYEISKTLKKNVSVQSNGKIELENYAADIQIRTTNENNVSINSFVEISGKSKEDVDKVLAEIENFEFEKSGGALRINTRYYKSINTNNNRSTITLQNGDKVKIKEIKIKHELYIPKSALLSLNNKYSDIEIESIDGDVDFELYNTKLFANDFNGELNISAKYSKIELESIANNAVFDFYDTDIVLQSCQNLNIKSKYSKYEIDEAGELDVDSYDDKFEVTKMTGLKFVSKYSDFESQADLNVIKLEIYDCNVSINSANNALVNGKYSDVNLGDVQTFKSDDLYDSNINTGSINRIEMGKSRYSSYDFKSVSNFKLDDTYDDDIKIGILNTDFSGLILNGKYSKLDVDANNVPFRVELNLKYPKFEIPESLNVTKHIEKNSELELTAGDSGALIHVEGYNMKVLINE